MTSDRKIRVLEVIQQGEIGGGESHLLTLISQMDRNKFEPVVIALSDGEMISRLTKAGIKNYVVASKYPFNFSIWKKMRAILGEEHIDIIHTHGARALSNLIYPARKLSIPVVHTVHGWSFHDHLPAWKKKLRVRGEKFLTGKADMNIAVSDSNKKIGLNTFGAFNCEVINNGVDLSVYSNAGQKDIRKELGIAPGDIVISFVARFIHDKNPIPLIKAFSNIHQEFPGSALVMVGNGPAREEAIQLAQQLGLADKIFFPGFRSDVPDILAASDIFCLPSIKEGLPVSLIEAMAMGNAVIATNVQGCVDVVTHNEDGLLVPLDDLENGLTGALKQLLGDTAFRKSLAAQGRRKVETNFNAVDMTRKIEQLYVNTLDRYKRPLPA